MSDTRREIVIRQLKEQEERQKKLRLELREIEKREQEKQKKDQQKRQKELGTLIDKLLLENLGENYFKSLEPERITDYLVQMFAKHKKDNVDQNNLTNQTDNSTEEQEDKDIAW